ncbi:MAG: accessory Sec system translocase SecA2, partial [Calditrichaeota bacterium]
GQLASVTISTNMAGRGVDIQLGPTSEEERRLVLELGGLYVIGTTRHESERIDRQLRGRAGRQGDPGASRFFISLEDDIFVRYQLKEIVPGNLDRINTRSSEKLQKYIHLIQKIIEGQNLEIKKTLVRYSELIDKQRQVLYLRRRAVLEGQIDLQFWQENSAEQYAFLVARTGIEQMTNACRQIEIFCIDNLWREHLAKLADRRDGIHLLRLGGQDPAFEFQKIAVNLFAHLLEVLETEMLKIFNALQVKAGGIDLERAGVKTPSATWTYLINDNPFENMFGVALIGNAGISLSIGAVMWTPLLAIYLLWKKLKRVTMQTRS